MAHFQQLKHRGGKWQARVRGSDGKERTRTFDKKVEAQRWAATQEADQARGQWVDPALGRMTFGAFVEVWRAGRHGLRDSSIERIDGVVDNRLLPRFGTTQLAKITHADVKAMVADDMIAGYSGSSVRRHVIVLRGILDAARLDGRVGRNVAEGVNLPREAARPMRALTADQLADLSDAMRPGFYRPLILSAGWLGLRWGELAGLGVANIDLLRHRVTVDRQLTEVAGRLEFGPPKSRAGVRSLSIPGGLTDVLAEHFAGEAVQRTGLAFPSVRGKLMRRSVVRRSWNKATAKVFYGTTMEGLVFHELRHTAASLAIAHGAHPVTVKERLGHSSISVTMDTYGHLFPSQDEALAEALDGTLRTSLAERSRNSEASVAHLRRSEP